MRARILLTSALLLSACGGGSAPPALDGSLSAKANGLNAEMNRRCTSLIGGTAVYTQDAACPLCSATFTQQSVDGMDETHATLHAPYETVRSVVVRATAAKGVVFPGGNNAALTMSANSEATVPVGENGGVNQTTQQNWDMTIRTFLDGVQQEEDSGTISLNDDPDTRHISGMTTTLPFDSIEAVFSRPVDPGNVNVVGPGPLSGGNVNVHEFCGGFDLSGLNVTGN